MAGLFERRDTQKPGEGIETFDQARNPKNIPPGWVFNALSGQYEKPPGGGENVFSRLKGLFRGKEEEPAPQQEMWPTADEYTNPDTGEIDYERLVQDYGEEGAKRIYDEWMSYGEFTSLPEAQSSAQDRLKAAMGKLGQ